MQYSKQSTEENIATKVHNTLKHALTKEGFNIFNIKIKPISTYGGNYLSELYEIDVTEENGDAREIHIFMKKIISGDNLTLWSIKLSHERELFFYNELSHIYNRLQDEANIPETKRYKVAKSFCDDDPSVLMLANFARKGYKHYGRLDIVSVQYAKMCMEQLAKLHALSFALEIKKPDYFNEKIRPKEHYFNFASKDWEIFFNKAARSVLDLLEGDYKERLLKFVPLLKEKMFRYNNDNDNNKCCVIHGDYKPPNIMALETNGVLMDILPIDYQMLQFGSPINDFLFFVFTGTDQEFRRNHLEHLKDIYFDTLTKFLKHFTVDINDVYPRKDFEREFIERLDYGLISFLMLAPFTFARDDHIPDFEIKIEDSNFSLVEEGKTRAEGVIEDYINWGIL